jgi:hypothetical protein
MSYKDTETWVQITIRECKYEGETDQAIYADLHTLQLTDMEEEPVEMHLSVSVKYQSTNTCAVTCNQMGRKLMNGTTADHSIPQESLGYLKQQDADPDSVHTVIETQSHLKNNSMSVAESFLQKFELSPNQMESNLTHCCIYNHCGSSTLNNNQSYRLWRNYITQRARNVAANQNLEVQVCRRHRSGHLCRLTHATANGYGGGTY